MSLAFVGLGKIENDLLEQGFARRLRTCSKACELFLLASQNLNFPVISHLQNAYRSSSLGLPKFAERAIVKSSSSYAI